MAFNIFTKTMSFFDLRLAITAREGEKQSLKMAERFTQECALGFSFLISG